MKSRRLCSLPV